MFVADVYFSGFALFFMPSHVEGAMGAMGRVPVWEGFCDVVAVEVGISRKCLLAPKLRQISERAMMGGCSAVHTSKREAQVSFRKISLEAVI